MKEFTEEKEIVYCNLLKHLQKFRDEIINSVGNGSERQQALIRLEETMFWTKAAIGRGLKKDWL